MPVRGRPTCCATSCGPHTIRGTRRIGTRLYAPAGDQVGRGIGYSNQWKLSFDNLPAETWEGVRNAQGTNGLPGALSNLLNAAFTNANFLIEPNGEGGLNWTQVEPTAWQSIGDFLHNRRQPGAGIAGALGPGGQRSGCGGGDLLCQAGGAGGQHSRVQRSGLLPDDRSRSRPVRQWAEKGTHLFSEASVEKRCVPFVLFQGFERETAGVVQKEGLDIIGAGDNNVRRVLGIPGTEPAADLLSIGKGGKFSITEIKASSGTGGADIDHALEQFENTARTLLERVPDAKLGVLEIALPQNGVLKGNYRIAGNQLVRDIEGTDGSCQTVRSHCNH